MELQAETDLIAIIKMQPVFGKHAYLVWAYLELFNITPMKAKTKKIRVILEEVKTLFQAEAFNFQKKTYRISLHGIAEALNTIVHRHFDMPLKSHGYLKSVMVTISEREEREKCRQAEQDLRKREDRLRYPVREEQVEPPGRGKGQGARVKEESESLTPEQIEENKRRVKELLKSMDKK